MQVDLLRLKQLVFCRLLFLLHVVSLQSTGAVVVKNTGRFVIMIVISRCYKCLSHCRPFAVSRVILFCMISMHCSRYIIGSCVS